MAERRIVVACCTVVHFALDAFIPIDRMSFYFEHLSVEALLADGAVLFVKVIVLELNFTAALDRDLNDLGSWANCILSRHHIAVSLSWSQTIFTACGARLACALLEV